MGATLCIWGGTLPVLAAAGEHSHSASDSRFAFLLILLIGYYGVVWLLAGRRPRPGAIVPQYAPPAGLSPAEMRYLLTGNCDRKTVAAVLAHLAAHKVISVQPEAGGYRITLLVESPPESLPREEASAFDALAQIQSLEPAGTEGPRTLLLQPAQGKKFFLVATIVAGSLMRRVSALYFKRNLGYSLSASLVSVAGAMMTAASFGSREGAAFLTLWFLLFSLLLGLIVVVNVIPAMRDAFRGILSARNVALTFVPLPVFVGIVGFVDVLIARATRPAFALFLAALVVVNLAGGVLIQTITPLARERMDQVAGFREFLASVELDGLQRMNDPHLTPALLNDYLAYAIALDLREAWGDHLADALFMTTTSTG
jgi:hypothetical protein